MSGSIRRRFNVSDYHVRGQLVNLAALPKAAGSAVRRCRAPCVGPLLRQRVHFACAVTDPRQCRTPDVRMFACHRRSVLAFAHPSSTRRASAESRFNCSTHPFSSGIAEVKGPFAKGSWSGPVEQAAKPLRGWLGLREKLIHSLEGYPRAASFPHRIALCLILLLYMRHADR